MNYSNYIFRRTARILHGINGEVQDVPAGLVHYHKLNLPDDRPVTYDEIVEQDVPMATYYSYEFIRRASDEELAVLFEFEALDSPIKIENQNSLF